MNRNTLKELELNKQFFNAAISSAIAAGDTSILPFYRAKIRGINRVINRIKHDHPLNNGPKRSFK